MDSESDKCAGLDLKSKCVFTGMGGRTSSILLENQHRFRHHSYQKPNSGNSAPASTWPRINPLASRNKTKTRPQGDDLGPFSISILKKQEQSKLSPIAPPPQEYTRASVAAPCPKLAFEQLVADAFLLREKIRTQTHLMLSEGA